MKKKFRFEAASDTEAAFIFCEYNPYMRGRIVKFRTLRDMDAHITSNLTIQVRRQLPIIIEILEVNSDDKKLVDSSGFVA